MPFVFAWRHRQHIVRMVQRPYDMIIGNASAAALVDRKYLRKIDRYPVGQLELLALELKAEKEFFERRIGLAVGAIEKLGLGPGFLAVAFPSRIFPSSNLNGLPVSRTVPWPFI